MTKLLLAGSEKYMIWVDVIHRQSYPDLDLLASPESAQFITLNPMSGNHLKSCWKLIPKTLQLAGCDALGYHCSGAFLTVPSWSWANEHLELKRKRKLRHVSACGMMGFIFIFFVFKSRHEELNSAPLAVHKCVWNPLAICETKPMLPQKKNDHHQKKHDTTSSI